MKAGRASETSILVARGLLIADATPSLGVVLPPGCAALTRRLLESAAPAWWFNFALRHAWTRALFFAMERASVPGLFRHFAMRKRLLDTVARDALRAGCSQLVVFGAGLDTLAWRMAVECACFEVDHPATQAAKRRVFESELAHRVPVLIPADLLSDSVKKALCAEGRFDAGAPTLFVAEGLLMYLPPERISTLLREAAACAGSGSRLVFTFLEARANRPPGFKDARSHVNRWLRRRGEPFTWALAREGAADFVARHGWRLEWLSTDLTIGESAALAKLPE
jgi:methyltransferase (TIGR00027 family)